MTLTFAITAPPGRSRSKVARRVRITAAPVSGATREHESLTGDERKAPIFFKAGCEFSPDVFSAGCKYSPHPRLAFSGDRMPVRSKKR
jgi:hypothetical protein